nr:zinc finger, CCHC-type [Tanacetum cinerariifolium]
MKSEFVTLTISQSPYLEKVLKKFNYLYCTLVSTPMDTSEKLMPNNGQAVSQLEYRVIGRQIGLISETIILQRLELKHKLLNINDMESKDYIQKSKVTWAIEGDENSKFFHGIINKKMSQLAIRGIFVDGSWCTEP